jgi:hypothetical protein
LTVSDGERDLAWLTPNSPWPAPESAAQPPRVDAANDSCLQYGWLADARPLGGRVTSGHGE